MEDVCCGCLCSGRKLRFIGDTDFYQLYSQILNEISVQTAQLCIRICWECCALLRKFDRFKAQVKRNYTELLWNISPSEPPHLTKTHIFNLSYPEPPFSHQPIQLTDVKEESVNDDIKREQEENGVMFVKDLPVHNEESTKKPKKKTKVKKISKSKVKVNKKKKLKKSETATELEKPCKVEEFPENQPLPESQQFLENQQLPEQRFPEKQLTETQELPETDDCISDRDVDGSLQDEDDKPLKSIKVDQFNSESKENTNNGVAEVLKAKPAAKSKIELLPEKPQCAECGKTFSSRKTYRYHINVLHKGNNQYPCPRCGKIYQWKSNLGRHMRTHKAVDDGELYCEQCDKSFASVATYRQHLRISRRHVTENEFSFTCNECGKKFVNKTRLRDHVDWEHLKKIKFRCQLCNKPFKCHTSLYVHLQNVHRNKEKKDNLCHVCGKSYQNAAKLKYHIIALHTGETPYQCSQCSAAFGWYSSLYRHIREVHYKVKSQPKKSKKAKKLEIEPPPYMNYHP